eukprot:scaffold36509_cov33-Tisochrysis_lutea.AAC.1
MRGIRRTRAANRAHRAPVPGRNPESSTRRAKGPREPPVPLATKWPKAQARLAQGPPTTGKGNARLTRC